MLSTKEFLDVFFGNSNEFFYIWTKQNKRTKCFKDTEEAAKYVETQKDNCDVYFGINTIHEKIGASNRARIDTVSTVTCLWVDLDISSGEHKKKNLPESITQAMDIMEEAFPVAPTLVVRTGGGVHVYWVFKEPYSVMENSENRERIINVEERLQEIIKQRFESYGLTCDKTHDLSRVYRVAGTKNFKDKDNIKDVEVIKSTSARYEINELEEILKQELWQNNIPLYKSEPTAEPPKEQTKKKEPAKKKVQEKKEEKQECKMPVEVDERKNPLNLQIDMNASPPEKKLLALMDLEPRFRMAFHMEDMKTKKTWSYSEYDMCLANYAANNEWSNQEICDLLISFRRMRGKTKDDREKVKRIDYVTETILKARQHRKIDESTRKLENFNLQAKETGKVPDSKEAILNALSSVIGIKILTIKKYCTNEPTYEIETERGDIFVKDTITLITERLLRAAIAAKTNHYLPGFGKGKWEPIAQNMLFICEDIEVAADADEKEILRELVYSYISKSQLTNDYNSAHLNEIPYMKNGKVHIFSHGFQYWLKVNGENISRKDIARIMKMLGFGHKKDNFYPDGGTPTSRNVYIINQEVVKGGKE